MLRRIIRLGLTALLVLGSGPAVTALSEDAEAEQALGEIVDQLNALEEWFTAAEKQTAAIEQQIKTQDQAIDRLGEQRRASETSLAAIRNSVAELEQEQNGLREDITAQRAAIVAHLQAAFRLSGDDFVKQILSQNSNADADRLMRYHGYFSEQRVAEMARFKANLTELTDTEQRLNLQLKKQTEQAQTLKEQSQALKEQRRDRRRAIQALADQRKTKADQQAALVADSERLRKLINELRRQPAALDGQAFARAKGLLPRPLKGKVRHKFGDTRAGTNLQWRGIDLAGAVGTAVTSVFRGQVVFSDWLRGFGLITIVDHGDGYMTLYGHADTLLKKPGDWVEGGEALARAGNSGGGYEPGIYFELRHKGTIENPASWLVQ